MGRACVTAAMFSLNVFFKISWFRLLGLCVRKESLNPQKLTFCLVLHVQSAVSVTRDRTAEYNLPVRRKQHTEELTCSDTRYTLVRSVP
jgi:hypothetical protein